MEDPNGYFRFWLKKSYDAMVYGIMFFLVKMQIKQQQTNARILNAIKNTLYKFKWKFTKTVKLPNTLFTTSKLHHEFKHAGKFGITGNWNKTSGQLYQKAIQKHINTANVYKSTYRGQKVFVYINKRTGIGAYTDLSGSYIGGWKFTPQQMRFHLTHGTKIK